MRALWLFTCCAALAGCGCEPEFVDCSLKCGAKNACPEKTECQAGYCRQPGAPGACVCRPGETRTCGSTVGECLAGTETCQSDRNWGACVGEGVPSVEICDGKDNDCNGAVDDNPADALPCERRLGVCAGKRHACVNGQYMLTCTAAEYGSEYQAAETRCDGLDNDCDGRVDSLSPRRLANAGPYLLLGFDGGFGLVTTRPGGSGWLVEGALFDSNLAPVGVTVQLATGTGSISGLSGVSRDERAVATWLVQSVPDAGPFIPDGVEWSRFAPAAPSRLAGLPPADDRGTGNFAAGLPGAGIVAAHLLTDGGAALLTWTSGSLPPSVGPFSVPNLTLVSVDSVVVSQQASAARWVGVALDDAGLAQDGGVVALVGGRSSLVKGQGQPLERGGGLQGAWLDSILQGAPAPRNESTVQVQYDAWDGGTFAVRSFPDYRAITSFGATQATTGLLLAWSESTTLILATPTTGTMLRTSSPFDGGVGQVQVASNGSAWNAVGWNAANGLNAMLVCAP